MLYEAVFGIQKEVRLDSANEDKSEYLIPTSFDIWIRFTESIRLFTIFVKFCWL